MPETRSKNALAQAHACPSTSKSSRHVWALALATLVATASLAGLVRPSHAEGTWQQQQFVTGTWSDLGDYPGDDANVHRQRVELAVRAHFNLLTNTVHHCYGSPFSWPSEASKRYPLLDLCSTISTADVPHLQMLVTDSKFTGCLSLTGTIPAFDTTTANQVLASFGPPNVTGARDASLFGYNLWDEPADWHSANFIKSWAAAMHANHSSRAVYLNMNPGSYGCTGDGLACFQSYLDSILVDSNVARQVDVASTDLYPFYGSPPTYSQQTYFGKMKALRAVMGTRPFWIISYAGMVADQGPPDPDINQLRLMATAPVAAGAKGILWFLFKSDNARVDNTSSPGAATMLYGGLIPTKKYAQISPMNHWLLDVAGPVVMNSTHVGLYHQATGPANEDLIANAPASCPVSNLGSSDLAVGVFRKTDSPYDYYLLVENKSLVPVSATVQLKGTTAYTVSQSPAIDGYVGGNSYTPLASGTSFAVSLQGGEGRLFHLTQAPSYDIALTDPVGGETWLPGQTRTVKWSGTTGPVTVKLFSDPPGQSPELDGPSTVLAAGVTGSQVTLTMPSKVHSRRAYIEITATGTDGITRRVHNAAPFATAPSPAVTISTWTMGTGNGTLASAIASDATGQVYAASRNANPVYTHGVTMSHYASGTWTSPAADVLMRGSGWDDWFTTIGTPGLAYDGQGRLHMASLYTMRQGDLGASSIFDANHTQGLTLFNATRNAGGTWDTLTSRTSFAAAPNDAGKLAMTGAPTGKVYIGYVTGGGSGTSVRVQELQDAQGTGVFSPGTYRSFATPSPRSVTMAGAFADTVWVALQSGAVGSEQLEVWRVADVAVNTLTLAGRYADLALTVDANGQPRLLYTTQGGNGQDQVLYRAYSAGAWNTLETVDASLGRVSGLALAVQAAVPRAAFTSNGVAKYADRVGGVWAVSPIDATKDNSGPVGLVYTPSGDRWVSYYDVTDDQLRVALVPASFHADNVPPATISNLAATGVLRTSLMLSWTAPGNDGTEGTASAYELRYATWPINAGNWTQATLLSTGTPLSAGMPESRCVDGLQSGGQYYFAIKSVDAAGNWSGLSNVASARMRSSGPLSICEPGGDGVLAPSLEEQQALDLPLALEMSVPRPNPAGTATTFSFGVPQSDAATRSQLVVFDIQGRLVRTLMNSATRAGRFTANWDLTNDAGVRVRPGVYLARLSRTNDRSITRTVLVVK